MVFPHGAPPEEKLAKPKEPEKPPQLDDAQKSAAMKALPARVEKCFLCKWILQDLLKNGNLTRHPKHELVPDLFPEKAKVAHLKLEKILL